MTTRISAAELVSDCFDELQVSRRVEPYVQKAEEAGYPQLAKMFRAVVTSETVREGLLREGMVHHADMTGDYFVCPLCGLIFHLELPEQCPVDETPGMAFITIQ